MEKNNKIIQLGNIMKKSAWDNPSCGRVYSVNGIAPTLTNMSGGVVEFR